LEICKKLGDQLGEGAACAALAQAFKEVGDTKLAIRYLEKYLDIATKNRQAVAQAEACAVWLNVCSGICMCISMIEQEAENGRKTHARCVEYLST
jgi:hypothetical protein